ncbi:MAG: hypothetical protein NTV51_21855 [Verrucomicrobia bacterium]|nr:hypothetical protein [Verrucomicrobiota bacterium]
MTNFTLRTLCLSLLLLIAALDVRAAIPRVFSSTFPNTTVFVRPGATSYTWSYGSDVNTIAYYNVPDPGFGWILTRGHYEYSSNGGNSWTTYTVVNNNQSPTYLPVTGKIWRFVDSLPADTTTSNAIGCSWFLFSAPASATSSGSNIMVDNAPTDITSSVYGVFVDAAVASTVAILTPTDTGEVIGGYWVLESQSVANLFTLTSDPSAGNTATLKLGTGTMPALGQTVTVTVRYYDTYQTDTAGAPLPGQGFSKTLTYTVVQDSTTDLAAFGSEFSVNTFTTNAQSAPAIARLSNGNTVMVWRSVAQDSDTGSAGGIYARIFNSAGTAQTAEIRISPLDNVNQLAPSVAALSNGRFVVSYTDASNSNDIVYRLVAADGTVGTALTAHAVTTGAQASSRVAALLDGTFVIVWVNPNNSNDISARVFNGTTGAALAAEFTVNSTTAGAQSLPDVAPLGGGTFIVVWRTDANSGDISARTANSSGGVSSEFNVVTTSGGQTAPRVAGFPDGKFVVTWTDPALDGDGSSENNIYFQRYSAAGTTAGSVTRANANIFGNQSASTISGFRDGGFLIAWTSTIQDADANGVYGRRFDSTGTAIDTSDVQINERRHYSQTTPAVAAGTSGTFTAVWTDSAQEGSGTTNNGIEARTYAPALVLPLGSQASQYGTSSTLASFTAQAGTDRLLVVVASHTGATNVSGVTFGGTAMTQAVLKNDGAVSVDSIWYLALGTSGTGTTGNIVVTYASTAGTGLEKFISASVFSGVSQSSPVSGPLSANTAGSTNVGSALTVTSTAGDLVFDVFDTFKPSAAPAVTVGTAQWIESAQGGAVTGGGTSAYRTSTRPGAASVAMSWTSDATDMIHCAINLKQAGAAAVAPSVTTPTSASVATTTATLGGNVTADGGATVTARGVVYALTSANSNPQISGTGVTNVPGSGTTGVFTVNVTSLTASSAYSFAAYATNSAGTAYSSVGTFNTTAPADTTPPTVASVVRKTPSTQSLANGTATVTFTVTYSEAVTGVAAARFAVEAVNGGTVTGTVGTPVVVSASIYDVPVTITGGSGEFRLKVID